MAVLNHNLVGDSLNHADAQSTSPLRLMPTRALTTRARRAHARRLFSIGLFVLNDDGTELLDAAGEPYETYDAEHILSFSRAWTGFTFSPSASLISPCSEHHCARPHAAD